MRRELFRDQWGVVHLHELGDGSTYAFVERPAGVVVVPIWGTQVLLVKQWRYPISAATWEVPAGAIDPGEEPLEAAARELFEETGLKSTSITPLTRIFEAGGYSTVQLHLFKAEVSGESLRNSSGLKTGEIQRVRWFSQAGILGEVARDGGTDASSLAALLMCGCS